MKISRRNFLKGSATTLFLAGFNFPVFASSTRKKNLIVIMLRGGMDGLTAVPVLGDKNFEKSRKKILIENPIKLNSDFARHPAARAAGPSSPFAGPGRRGGPLLRSARKPGAGLGAPSHSEGREHS